MNEQHPSSQRTVPYLLYRDAPAAIDFLTRAFGFEERFRCAMDDGRIGHAEMTYQGSVVMLASACGGFGKSPHDLPNVHGLTVCVVDHVDAHFERARSAVRAGRGRGSGRSGAGLPGASQAAVTPSPVRATARRPRYPPRSSRQTAVARQHLEQHHAERPHVAQVFKDDAGRHCTVDDNSRNKVRNVRGDSSASGLGSHGAGRG